ncbi:hypothetical protein AK812_SmicGene23013 [Symbiodinium microadriaticum]|uniref:Uncharacterized protein n=1 Tax=Symbiodinium microadriaticum TaxID=2951 RepID=A0A1Q9DID0_SYMMI|nr:hypothetical protein AK812_SmicGene23013 [Symbiodinium microadriaticum]
MLCSLRPPFGVRSRTLPPRALRRLVAKAKTALDDPVTHRQAPETLHLRLPPDVETALAASAVDRTDLALQPSTCLAWRNILDRFNTDKDPGNQQGYHSYHCDFF